MLLNPARLMICLVLTSALALVVGACDTAQATAPAVAPTSVPATPTAPAAAPRTLTVLAGAGQETRVVMAFFPERVRVRAGDTVTWKLNVDEIITVNFLGGEPPAAFNLPLPGGVPGERMRNPKVFFPTRAPGAPVETYSGAGYAGSGVLAKQPYTGAAPNETFSMKFDKPGIYQYESIVAEPAKGTVEVLPATVGDVPAQAQIDAQAKAEMAALLAPFDAIQDQGKQARVESAPNNSSIAFVRAGSIDFRSGDQRSQLYEFLPKNLTIKAGDTVVWTSNFIHTVTFNPVPPPPDVLLPKPQPQGFPILALNPRVFVPAKPAANYDPTKYYNSAPIGLFTPNGNNTSLTFDTPGTYDYYCALHQELGMKATIVVQPK